MRVALEHDRPRVIKNYVITASLYVAIASLFGVPGVVLMAGAGACSILILEATNYSEHAGVECVTPQTHTHIHHHTD